MRVRFGDSIPAPVTMLRVCFRDPIAEFDTVALKLAEAVVAHREGDSSKAASLIASTNTPAMREWIDSLWGKKSPYVKRVPVSSAQPQTIEGRRARMPSAKQKRALHDRDGYHCRFCGVPVIRAETRARIHRAYPSALTWGRLNIEQHAAFQAMWAQYDHVLPFTRGGSDDLNNIVIACAGCNFGRMECTLDEVGLSDPRLRTPRVSSWNGLEDFR